MTSTPSSKITNVSIPLIIVIDYSGQVVSSGEPTEKLGLYWGYSVRVANKFEDIFDECPYQGKGYDLKIAISNDKNC